MERINAVIILFLIPSIAFADADSVGRIGANAVGLKLPDGGPLDGDNVTIGQVEPGRVAALGLDSDESSNENVLPFLSRLKNGIVPGLDEGVDSHAMRVASIMIGRDEAPPSMAPFADLYSSGYVEPSTSDDLLRASWDRSSLTTRCGAE